MLGFFDAHCRTQFRIVFFHFLNLSIMLVVNLPSVQLYGILSHCHVIHRYGVRGCRFRVYKYGSSYIHRCRYYYFVSQLPF